MVAKKKLLQFFHDLWSRLWTNLKSLFLRGRIKLKFLLICRTHLITPLKIWRIFWLTSSKTVYAWSKYT